jgi:acyl-CoA hydrolase
MKIVSAQEAVKVIKSGDSVHVHAIACAPQQLIAAMVERGKAGELRNVTVRHLHTEGPAHYADKSLEGCFQLNSYFVGGNARKATQEGYADYIPVFLGETQRLIREGYTPVNVALISVSPPDKHGFVSLGTSVEATLAAVENADTVIASINPSVPRAFGDAMIPVSYIDIWTEDNTPIIAHDPADPDETETIIGKHVAALVEDGATIQMGIGALPNAVLAQLGNHKNLGIHTEMFADGVLPLIAKGVITGSEKALDRGRIVATFLMGSRKLYDFIDDNPAVRMMDVGYTNSLEVIKRNPKVTSINSAIEVDITGQVCADSIGTKHFSGVGGQIDFLRGASLSKGGKPILALPSQTNKGVSKLVPTLKVGAGVVTTRASIHWLVTEFGAVNLYGKSLQERARLVMSIAHPDHKEVLDKAAFERFGPHFHHIPSITK